MKESTLQGKWRVSYIPDKTDSGVLKAKEIVLCYGENKKKGHRVHRIGYWYSANEQLFEFVTNILNYRQRK